MTTQSYGEGKYVVYVGSIGHKYRSLAAAKSFARAMSREYSGDRFKVFTDLDGRMYPLVGYERGKPISV